MMRKFMQLLVIVKIGARSQTMGRKTKFNIVDQRETSIFSLSSQGLMMENPRRFHNLGML